MAKTMKDYIGEIYQEFGNEGESYAGEFYDMACARRDAEAEQKQVTPCIICGDTRESEEGWECPGCGSI